MKHSPNQNCATCLDEECKRHPDAVGGIWCRAGTTADAKVVSDVRPCNSPRTRSDVSHELDLNRELASTRKKLSG